MVSKKILGIFILSVPHKTTLSVLIYVFALQPQGNRNESFKYKQICLGLPCICGRVLCGFGFFPLGGVWFF